MKSNTFRANPFKFAVSLCTSAIALVLSLCMLLSLARPGSAAVFLVIAAVFCIVATIYGAKIRISDEGIARINILGRETRHLSWQDIQEIGVAGTSVFRKDDTKHPGTLYIYFSEEVMTDQDRFNLMLSFPPRDRLFLTYSEERIRAIQLRWNRKIESYHAGHITFS